MNYGRLRVSTVEELRSYASSQNIYLHSRTFLPIIQSDIAFALGFSPQMPFLDRFYLGVDIRDYFDYAGIKENISEELIDDYLRGKGIHTEYLIARKYVLGVYLYENNISTPEIFWMNDGQNLIKSIYEYYRMCDAEFQNFPYNISQDNYLLQIGNRFFRFLDYQSKNVVQFKELMISSLCYQKISDLYHFANLFGENYIRSKKGVLIFLNRMLDSVDSRKKWREKWEKFIISLCDYPGRQELITQWEGPNIFLRSKQFSKYYPPYEFERKVLLAGNYTVDLIELINEFFTPGQNEGGFDLISRNTISDMILRKDSNLLYFSTYVIMESCGWSRMSTIGFNLDSLGNFEIIDEIKANMEEANFYLVDQLHLCHRNLDVYDQQHTGFVITYGTFTNFECYSPIELENAFIIENGQALFRIPTNPSRVFPSEKMKNLLDILQEQDPTKMEDFQQKTSGLIRKLIRIFSEINIITLRETLEELRQLQPSDKDHLINIFFSLFKAGMYQRTWEGPGHPYPMKISETRGSCLRKIEEKMTPEFAKIEEEYSQISNKEVIENLTLLYTAAEIYPQKMMEFIRQTTQGDYCIGGGSRLMIETGYNYLNLLDVKVLDFDYAEFEGESTHR